MSLKETARLGPRAVSQSNIRHVFRRALGASETRRMGHVGADRPDSGGNVSSTQHLLRCFGFAVNRAPQTEGSREQCCTCVGQNMPWHHGLTSDPMSLTVVRARQYNGGSSHAFSEPRHRCPKLFAWLDPAPHRDVPSTYLSQLSPAGSLESVWPDKQSEPTINTNLMT